MEYGNLKKNVFKVFDYAKSDSKVKKQLEFDKKF